MDGLPGPCATPILGLLLCDVRTLDSSSCWEGAKAGLEKLDGVKDMLEAFGDSKLLFNEELDALFERVGIFED